LRRPSKQSIDLCVEDLELGIPADGRDAHLRRGHHHLTKRLLLYCRAGFEGECGEEIAAYMASAGTVGASATQAGGFVVYAPYRVGECSRPPSHLHRARPHLDELIFSRQMVDIDHVIENLPQKDRLTPLLTVLSDASGRFGSVVVEHPDTDEGKRLSGFCRRFTSVFSAAAGERGLLDVQRAQELPRLHVFFSAPDCCYLGRTDALRSSPWSMGIPRVKYPAGAPSRSTLKLAEAFMTFLSSEEQQQRLGAGLRVVDLGAAPGGWSWQFASRGMRVQAVDNGPLAGELLASGMVEHVREDGFRYRPRRPVDWMVCDMVEKPARVARLVAEWVARGDCRECIFNLKLPMKKRYAAVVEAREQISSILRGDGVRHKLRLKQLYHDREEVTGHLRRLSASRTRRY
jgi:23S rRNA (cytidine2498-2'-O)-methyltransferase